MKSQPRSSKGQPIVALAVLLLAWAGYRAMVWENPLYTLPDLALVDVGDEPSVRPTVSDAVQLPGDLLVPETPMVSARTLRGAGQRDQAWNAAMMKLAPPSPMFRSNPGGELPSLATPAPSLSTAGPPAAIIAPTSTSNSPNAAAVPSNTPIGPSEGQRRSDHWSLDMWAFARPGGIGPVAGGIQTTSYGASQGGAVLRYRLSKSARRPTAYARVTASPGTGPISAQQDAALGLSVRPLAALPVAAYAEARATRTSKTVDLRPAAFLATEFPPLDLPFSTEARAYAQTGYVGGDFATAFADGQVALDHKLAKTSLGDLRLGGGAWAGAQKGASRVDIGPTARLEFDLADKPVTLQIDYRFQVAGDAQPGSGVAVTLSSGL